MDLAGQLLSECPVCGAPKTYHDHDTGNIRGLLCRACNSAIGLLKSCPKIIRNAAKYLEERQ